MATYRAAYYGDTVLTSPDQRTLPEDALIAAAIAEAHHADIIGSEYPRISEGELRSGLTVGDWTDGGDEEVPEPVAAGFAVVQERLAIFGVGKTEAEARADAAYWVDKGEDGEPSFDGLDVIPCSQALMDEVRANGVPSRWKTVDGVACTDEQADAWGE